MCGGGDKNHGKSDAVALVFSADSPTSNILFFSNAPGQRTPQSKSASVQPSYK
jgi:hypothetical protein